MVAIKWQPLGCYSWEASWVFLIASSGPWSSLTRRANCSLAWGGKLGKASDAAVAAGVLNGTDAGLTDQEKAMAAWARKIAKDPNATTPADIQALRDSGLDDGQIFAITGFVALRLAFSTINDSLGAQPDAQLALSLPQEVRETVTYGRPIAT